MWNLKDSNQVVGIQNKVTLNINLSGKLLQETHFRHVLHKAPYQGRITLETFFLLIEVQQQVPPKYSFCHRINSEHNVTESRKLNPHESSREHYHQ